MIWPGALKLEFRKHSSTKLENELHVEKSFGDADNIFWKW